MMKEKIVVLFANPYDMISDRTGEKMVGVSVSYLYGDSLVPALHSNGSMGQRPAKGSVSIALLDKFVNAPALYDGSFDMAIGSDGKPTLKLVDVDYITTVSLVSQKEVDAQVFAKPAAPTAKEGAK